MVECYFSKLYHRHSKFIVISWSTGSNTGDYSRFNIYSENHLCVQFILQQVGFYYVLTRLLISSDAVEGTFSHVILKGGSNDATDTRAAEYALWQILGCGIVKSSKLANTAEFTGYISLAKLKKLKIKTKIRFM